MNDLSTKYMGMKLRNPLVVSASRLTGTLGGVERAAQYGAGAVVLKSLFEEQIDFELERDRDESTFAVHPEGEEYLGRLGKQLGPAGYVELIRKAKHSVDVPIIASVNCVSSRWWNDWTLQLEDAGADGLELNIAIMPKSDAESSQRIEERYIDIVEKVAGRVDIPVAVKIGPYFTSLPHIARCFAACGASGLVLFNRFYQLDVNVETVDVAPANHLSTRAELDHTLRWTAILCGNTSCDIAAGTGVETAEDVIRLLLCGARVVQVCSALFRNGYPYIDTLIEELRSWMERHDFSSIDEVRGRLGSRVSAKPAVYERLQYIKALTGIS